MEEYSVILNNKNIGKVNIYKENINKDLNNIIIKTNNNSKYIFKEIDNQTFIIRVKINNIQDLYEIINLYNKDNINKEIDNIKKINNISNLKNKNIIDIEVPYKYINKFNKSINDINIESLLKSKIYFIEQVLKNIDIINMENELNRIIKSYNELINKDEYEFYTEDEKNNIYNEYIIKIDKIIKTIENNSNYKYSRDFIKSIRLN